jgi:hypothetical protein
VEDDPEQPASAPPLITTSAASAASAPRRRLGRDDRPAGRAVTGLSLMRLAAE